jgi:hypothetical protein
MFIPRLRGHTKANLMEAINALVMDGLQQHVDAKKYGSFLRNQTTTSTWPTTDGKLDVMFTIRANDNSPQVDCTFKLTLAFLTVDDSNNVVDHNDNHNLGDGRGQIARTFLSVDRKPTLDCGFSTTGGILVFLAQRTLDVLDYLTGRLSSLILWLATDMDSIDPGILEKIEKTILVGVLSVLADGSPELDRLPPPLYFCFPSIDVNHALVAGPYNGGLTVCDPNR